MTTTINRHDLHRAHLALHDPQYIASRCCGARSDMGHCMISKNNDKDYLDVMEDVKWKCGCCKGYSTLQRLPRITHVNEFGEYDYSEDEYDEFAM